MNIIIEVAEMLGIKEGKALTWLKKKSISCHIMEGTEKI